LEYRNTDPNHWNTENKQEKWEHWNEWGLYTGLRKIDDKKIKGQLQPEEITIQWHIPSADELQIAANLLIEQLQAPVWYLERFARGDLSEVKKDREKKRTR